MKYIAEELKKFSHQIKFAVENYTNHGVKQKDFDNALIGGLGGSGIAGRMIKNYFNDKLDFPIEVVSDYSLPKYIGSRSLVILSSYSGNTEETIAMYHDAKQRGCKIVVLTTGGQLLKLAQADGILYYLAEAASQPRMALGYPFTYLFLLFFEFLGQEKKADFLQISSRVAHNDDYITRSADLFKTFAHTVKNKFVIICDPVFEGIAIRFAQQIQENAKHEAFVSVIPESNHNVIETYYNDTHSNFVFFNSGFNKRTGLRFAFLKDLLKKHNGVIEEIHITDQSIATIFDTIFLLDWLSLQIADSLHAVSNTVPNIMALKGFLSNK